MSMVELDDVDRESWSCHILQPSKGIVLGVYVCGGGASMAW